MLQDEMTFQRIEVLLDMQAKKLLAELEKIREELSQAKEELRKEIHNVKQDNFASAGPARVQMYADAPPHQEPQPVPRYAQEPAPQYAQQGQRYAQEPEQYPEPRYAEQYPQHPAPQYAQHPGQPVYADAMPANAPRERPPENRPIDRNGVAPADVSVEKFFYMGAKKK